MTHSTQSRGYITILVLVFGGVFFVIVSSLAGLILLQNKLQLAKENREKAIQIAEAGLDYYKWFLAHFPDDLQDGTGGPGPYAHEYDDPEGGIAGTFSLDISGNQQCGTVTSVNIYSTGWSANDSGLTRTLYGKYARPSVAEYSYILNSNVWAGADRTIVGRYHSNGGIRMDGENQSLVTSSVPNWSCTSTFGCNPTATQPGIFGAGENNELWDYPVPQIDFAGITSDLVTMKSLAQSSGRYFADSGQLGYRLVFQNNGTFNLYRVTSADDEWGFSNENGWELDAHTITGQTFLGNYTIPANCGLVFVEDQAWIEGVVNGKVTVAVADLADAGTPTDAILNGNITYAALDGTDGLTVVAEGDVLIPLQSPDNMTLRGIFIAQNGKFGRHYYDGASSPTHYKKDTLSIFGTIVSNQREGTKWACSGVYCSGYETRNNAYDRTQMTNPPPLTPYVSEDFRFVEWREE